VKDKAKYLLKFAGLFVYFSVALFLIVASAGAAAGGLFFDNALGGIIVVFSGAMLLVGGSIGKTMLTKIQVSYEDLRRAFKKAADTVEDEKANKPK